MKNYINNTLNYYDNNSSKYKNDWTDEFLNNYQFDVPEIFLSYLKPNSYILDLGCGTGRDSKFFIEKGHRVKSIDGSRGMCKIASETLKVAVEQMNFLDINYNKEFDGVFACCSLLHLNTQDLILCLKKVCDSLKNNGVLYASFKLGRDEKIVNNRFYNDMTEDKFKKICDNILDFKIVKTWTTDQYNTDTKFINFIVLKNIN